MAGTRRTGLSFPPITLTILKIRESHVNVTWPFALRKLAAADGLIIPHRRAAGINPRQTNVAEGVMRNAELPARDQRPRSHFELNGMRNRNLRRVLRESTPAQPIAETHATCWHGWTFETS
jgi:hypothetical protein